MPYLLEHAHAIRADRGGQSFISVDNGVIEVGETQHGCRMDRGGFQDRQTDPALGTRHMIVDQSVGNRSIVGQIGSMCRPRNAIRYLRSEEHTSELQSLMRISYAVFCLKK